MYLGIFSLPACNFLIASFQEQHKFLKPSMIITYILVVPVT